VEVKLHAFLISAIDGDEWSASRLGRFTPSTHWIRGWVGPIAGLDAVVKRNESHHCSCRESNSGRPARSLVSTLTELPRFIFSTV